MRAYLWFGTHEAKKKILHMISYSTYCDTMCNTINKTWNGYYISYHTPKYFSPRSTEKYQSKWQWNEATYTHTRVYLYAISLWLWHLSAIHSRHNPNCTSNQTNIHFIVSKYFLSFSLFFCKHSNSTHE